MSKRKPIIVTLKERRDHKWTFVIDLPGSPNKQTKRELYTRKDAASRGARRQLEAFHWSELPPHEGVGRTPDQRWWAVTRGRYTPIEFVVG